MIQAIKRKWLRALRSGAYVQGKGALCQEMVDGDVFCCLGVLTDLYAREKRLCWVTRLSLEANTLSLETNRETSGLPVEVRAWAGLDRDAAGLTCELIDMNDEGTPFTEIADYIEKYL